MPVAKLELDCSFKATPLSVATFNVCARPYVNPNVLFDAWISATGIPPVKLRAPKNKKGKGKGERKMNEKTQGGENK